MAFRPIQTSSAVTNSADAGDRQIYLAAGIGMIFNLVSIYVGNPYLVNFLMIPIALVATIKWRDQPMPWIALASVVAANPVNLNASVACNLVFAIFLFILDMRNMNRLPTWLYLFASIAAASIVGSTVNWGETGEVSTQLAAIGNYVVGPFLLIPIIYFRLQRISDANLLLKVLVVALILPSVIFLLLARLFGTPIIDITSSDFDYLVNVSVYQLGRVDFQLTRTQVGIPLAVLICSSAAVAIANPGKRLRIVCLSALVANIFLLFVTGSIGSTLSALLGLALILAVASRYFTIKQYLYVIPVLAVLAVLGWSQVPQGVKAYLESRYEEKLAGGVDVSDRSSRWQPALAYLADNPLGRGWELYIPSIGVHPHNDYLSYGIAFGVLCGLVYLLVPVTVWCALVFGRFRTRDPARIAVLLAGIGAVTVLTVNSFADHLTANRWYFNVVWSIVWYGYFVGRSPETLNRIGRVVNRVAP